MERKYKNKTIEILNQIRRIGKFHKGLQLEAVKQDGMAISAIPEYERDFFVCRTAYYQNRLSRRYWPKDHNFHLQSHFMEDLDDLNDYIIFLDKGG